ncbi:unnamed protein product, partial [Aphanomyces euteiches]
SNKSKKSTWTTLSFYRRDMAWFLILDHKRRVHFQRSMNKSLHESNKSKKSTWTTLSFYRRDMAWFLILDHKRREHLLSWTNKLCH